MNLLNGLWENAPRNHMENYIVMRHLWFFLSIISLSVCVWLCSFVQTHEKTKKRNQNLSIRWSNNKMHEMAGETAKAFLTRTIWSKTKFVTLQLWFLDLNSSWIRWQEFHTAAFIQNDFFSFRISLHSFQIWIIILKWFFFICNLSKIPWVQMMIYENYVSLLRSNTFFRSLSSSVRFFELQ